MNEILDSRRCGGRLEYFIDWEGYGQEERSWVTRYDILDPSPLTRFHESKPNCPAPRPRGRPRRQDRWPAGAVRGGEGTVTGALGSLTTALKRALSSPFAIT